MGSFLYVVRGPESRRNLGHTYVDDLDALRIRNKERKQRIKEVVRNLSDTPGLLSCRSIVQKV